MRTRAGRDVWMVWLYAAATVALGAWISPLLYNAGKALAEVSSSRTTNGPMEWLGTACRTADFPRFFIVSLIVAAGFLMFPWLEWLYANRGKAAAAGGADPQAADPADRTRQPAVGGRLGKIARGLWHGVAGFVLVAGMWFALAGVLVLAGVFVPRHPLIGLAGFALRTWAGSLTVAVVLGVFFEGIAMGVFLRAMRPSAALGMNAALFMLTLAVIPPPGLNVADPDAAGTGFEMLRLVVWRFGEYQGVCQTLVPLAALGGVLAYARWRTASLCLPVGLLTGWLFARGMHQSLLGPGRAGTSLLSGSSFQHGWIPLLAIVVAGVLAHYLTATPDDERSHHS